MQLSSVRHLTFNWWTKRQIYRTRNSAPSIGESTPWRYCYQWRVYTIRKLTGPLSALNLTHRMIWDIKRSKRDIQQATNSDHDTVVIEYVARLQDIAHEITFLSIHYTSNVTEKERIGKLNFFVINCCMPRPIYLREWWTVFFLL